jgi:alanine dehydrogenase
MPGAVPVTSTFALTNATLPYVVELAGKGLKKALGENAALAKGLNVCRGRIVHSGVADAVGETAAPLETCLAS